MAQPADDTGILQRIADGDQDALQQLYDAYYARLWRFLWYEMEGNTGLIEEVLQDVFFAVWRSAAQFRHQAQVATWLFQIAHRHALNARRSRLHRPEESTLPLADDEGSEEANGATSPEDVIVSRLMLSDALRRLSAMHQIMLNLFFHQGFSQAEIAQILDIPIGTVKSRLNAARRALFKRLQAHQSGEATARDA